MSDINGGGVDSGVVGRRAFVARSEIEKESALPLELDSELEYSNLVWVVPAMEPGYYSGLKKKKEILILEKNTWEMWIGSATIPRAQLDPRRIWAELQFLKCSGLFVPGGELHISHFRPGTSSQRQWTPIRKYIIIQKRQRHLICKRLLRRKHK